MKKYKEFIFVIIIIISCVIHCLRPYLLTKKIEDEEEKALEDMNMEEPFSDDEPKQEKKYIRWMEFKVPYKLLAKAMAVDINSYGKDIHYNWIEILAYLSAKNGGNIERCTETDLSKLITLIESEEMFDEMAEKLKYYNFYKEAYSAVLSGFLGEYSKMIVNENGEKEEKLMYGLKVFSPIAKGFAYSHYDDFGSKRSYGYNRKHQGHDLMGNVGTPIIAVEDGTVEAVGWNQYGGWRIGIRSNDKKRYYYYAHLRKNHPYHSDIVEGASVKAGDVIGYMGMTGYSTKENVNNITTPHLHFGLEIIFDESQKDGTTQLWMDLYAITELLEKNKSIVIKDEQTKEYYSTNQNIKRGY